MQFKWDIDLVALVVSASVFILMSALGLSLYYQNYFLFAALIFLFFAVLVYFFIALVRSIE